MLVFKVTSKTVIVIVFWFGATLELEIKQLKFVENI